MVVHAMSLARGHLMCVCARLDIKTHTVKLVAFTISGLFHVDSV